MDKLTLQVIAQNRGIFSPKLCEEFPWLSVLSILFVLSLSFCNMRETAFIKSGFQNLKKYWKSIKLLILTEKQKLSA